VCRVPMKLSEIARSLRKTTLHVLSHEKGMKSMSFQHIWQVEMMLKSERTLMECLLDYY
jgi:hypothetical protein